MAEQKTTQQKSGRSGRVILIVALVCVLALVLLILGVVLAGQARPARTVATRPEWVTGAARSVRVGALIVAGLVGLGVVYSRGLQVYDDVTARRRQAVQDRLTEEHIATQNKLQAVRRFEPNAAGRLGVTMDVQGHYRDMDNLRVYTQLTTVYLEPILEQVHAIRSMLEAGQGWPAAAAQERLLDAGQGSAMVLRESTELDRLLTRYAFKPQLTRVLIGEYVDAQTNSTMPLTLSIPQAVHVLCVGASGQGKSTLLEAMALQLAGLEGVRLAAIDYGSGTFDAMEDALHWQIAETPALAISLLQELLKVCQERKEMYKQVTRVRSLDQYNAMTGKGLPFVVAFADETSALLEHDGTKSLFVELARTGRKYGVGLILGGTDFKATTLPSEARSNCQARVSFWLEPGLSRSLFGCEEASELREHEIAVQRPGIVGRVRGYPPLVTEASYRQLPRRRGAVLALNAAPVATSSPGGLDPDQVRQILEMHAAGESKRAIQRAVFGYEGGAAYAQVNQVLARGTTGTGGTEDVPGSRKNGHAGSSSIEFCDFCGRSVDDAPSGVTFAPCAGCGVGICSDCLADAGGEVCPDCAGGEGG